jgi:sec-independent protein translocase protein TatA
MLGSLGWQELLIILVILALLFGANRVAGIGGALGRGIRDFRSEAKGEDPAQEESKNTTSAPATPPRAVEPPTAPVAASTPAATSEETPPPTDESKP